MGRVILRASVPQAKGSFRATREDSGRRLGPSFVVNRADIVGPGPNKELVPVAAVGVELRVEVRPATAHPA